MATLKTDQEEYLRNRGFVLVTEPIDNKPYLSMGPSTSTFPPEELVFYHQFHTGNFVCNDHPENTSPEDLVSRIEEMVAQGKSQRIFSTPQGVAIPIIVTDASWNPIVNLLLDKYSE